MQTQCSQQQLEFQALGARRLVAKFDAGHISSDAGALLLREVELRTGIVDRFAACFIDHRDATRVEHSVTEMLTQRVFGLCLGYEDLNDHDRLRNDPVLATACGKTDPTGQSRSRVRDRGRALAGRSTLNRLELTRSDATRKSRYKKVVADAEAIQRFFVSDYIDAQCGTDPERIVLDIDPSDIALHGEQEGRFYHGYYGRYCYLPLYIFIGQALVYCGLRRSNIDGCAGTTEVLDWLVPMLREQWPTVEIAVRGDSGFARELIFAWCETNGVDYIIGLARNPRLTERIAPELAEVLAEHEQTGRAARRFAEFSYRTQKSWSRSRRVVGKAEQLPGKPNPRFVVTSYSADRFPARDIYEQEYCIRGEMENRIKEQQLDLFGDRASAGTMRANQIRIWEAGVAYLLICELRRTGLVGTELERAQAGTIRTRLMKVGALVTISVRRIRIALSSAFPLQEVFFQVLANLDAKYRVPT